MASGGAQARRGAASRGRVLVIAGSDSGGGAGIQADIKTVTALGGFAMTAVTALTAQDTRRVAAIHAPPSDFLRLQMAMAFEDLGADAVKLGMLHDSETLGVVAGFLEKSAAHVPVVVDPVMVSASGDRLLLDDAEAALRNRIAPCATLLTPNLGEAERLLARSIPSSEEGLVRAAQELRSLGSYAVLLKGGHLSDPDGAPSRVVIDVLASPEGVRRWSTPRLPLRGSPHGTGCTLASAAATGLSFGLALEDSVARARDFVHGALAHAQGFGSGNTPLNHAWRIPRLDS